MGVTSGMRATDRKNLRAASALWKRPVGLLATMVCGEMRRATKIELLERSPAFDRVAFRLWKT